MTTTWIPGYLGEITLDTDDFSVVGQTMSFNATKTNPTKATFGSRTMKRVSGMKDATIDCAGHIAAELPIAELFALLDSEESFAFSIQVGELGGDTDGGIISGLAIASDFTIDADAEGEWDWSATLETDGDYAHTPAV